jgi:hypothetical protein
MHLEVHEVVQGCRVQSMYTMTPMCKDRHMDKFKRVKLISMYPSPWICY